METERMLELRARMKKDNMKWVAVVTTTEKIEEVGMGFEMKQNFYSSDSDIANVIHKIELDLMTNLHNGLKGPISVKIAKVK